MTIGEKSKQVYKLLDENPNLGPTEIAKQLGIPEGTASSAKNRWKKAKGLPIGTKEHHIYPSRQPRALSPTDITFEQILKAVPDIETLSRMTFEGMMAVIKDRDETTEALRQKMRQEIVELQGKYSGLAKRLEEVTEEKNEVTEEKNKITTQYNELLAKRRVGSLEVDSARRRLIPKF